MATRKASGVRPKVGPRVRPKVRKGQLDVKLDREQFAARFRERFYDPAFEKQREDMDALLEVAWESYDEYRKSPRRRPAGAGFADPSYELPIEWLEARRRVQEAQKSRRARRKRIRVLLVNGSARNDQTCPGEMSKTHRLLELARGELAKQPDVDIDVLDLSRLTAEYGRVIYPCKACVSTAMPLCHWPCSCYPNHAIGQVNDWMNEIYPMWAAADGIMIVAPVYWYQAPSVLKLMMDRLVCADGGNPDPTTTSLKDPKKAKALELAGWHYPRHLAGRVFSIVVHGDAAGCESLRRNLHDWLNDMHLVSAGADAMLDRYIGYYEPYATSHETLDGDKAVQAEVLNVATAFAEAVRKAKAGELQRPDVEDPRPK
jgi:multimeric flavodoxin WrbA